MTILTCRRNVRRYDDRMNAQHTPQRVTRREILNYIWLASMALLLAKAGSVTFAFALPRRPTLSADLRIDALPAVNDEPLLTDIVISQDSTASIPKNGGNIAPANYRIVIANTPAGIFAFINRCTHHGCTLHWNETREIFECPCHGSQFERDGAYIAGPAPRALDRFPITAKDAQGNVIARSGDDGLLPLPANAARITIDHSALILGRSRF